MRKIYFIFITSIFAFLFLCSGQVYGKDITQNTKQIVAHIKQIYAAIDDFKAKFVQENMIQNVKTQTKGDLYYKAPNKFKSKIEMQSSDESLNMTNLTVFDGKTFWQEQIFRENKVANVLKSTLDETNPQRQMLLQQFDMRNQFEQFLKQYDIVEVKEGLVDSQQAYILNMELKLEEKNKMQQLIKAYGNREENTIPLRVLFYWSKLDNFCLKIETLNLNNEKISSISYRDVKINSNLSDEIFAYTPPAGIEVVDITKIMQKEVRKREFDGIENEKVGQIAPEFSLFDLSGEKYELAKFAGKIIIINFWAYWYPSCQQELPLIAEIYQDFAHDEMVHVLTITNEKEKTKQFVEDNGYIFPVLIDETNKVINDYGVVSIPRTFVIDQQGKFVAVYIGYHANIKDILEKDIARLKPEE